jgi:hypothetical protein
VDDAGRRRLALRESVVRLGLDDLYATRLELCAQRAEVLFVEVVLGREDVERELVEKADLLGVLQEGPGIDFQQIAQFSSLLRGYSPGASMSPDRRLLQRKTTRGCFRFRSANVKTLQIPGI